MINVLFADSQYPKRCSQLATCWKYFYVNFNRTFPVLHLKNLIVTKKSYFQTISEWNAAYTKKVKSSYEKKLSWQKILLNDLKCTKILFLTTNFFSFTIFFMIHDEHFTALFMAIIKKWNNLFTFSCGERKIFFCENKLPKLIEFICYQIKNVKKLIKIFFLNFFHQRFES